MIFTLLGGERGDVRAEFFRVAVRSASPLCRCVGVCSGACWLPMKHFGGGAVPAGKDATAGRVDLYLRVQCVDEGGDPLGSDCVTSFATLSESVFSGRSS